MTSTLDDVFTSGRPLLLLSSSAMINDSSASYAAALPVAVFRSADGDAPASGADEDVVVHFRSIERADDDGPAGFADESTSFPVFPFEYNARTGLKTGVTLACLLAAFILFLLIKIRCTRACWIGCVARLPGGRALVTPKPRAMVAAAGRLHVESVAECLMRFEEELQIDVIGVEESENYSERSRTFGSSESDFEIGDLGAASDDSCRSSTTDRSLPPDGAAPVTGTGSGSPVVVDAASRGLQMCAQQFGSAESSRKT